MRVLSYGSGLAHDIFCLAFKRFHKDFPLARVTCPKLPWTDSKGGKPGSIVITPPLVQILQELELWDQIKEKATKLQQFTTRLGDITSHIETSTLSEPSRLSWLGLTKRSQLRQLADVDFWIVPTPILEAAIREELKTQDVSSYLLQLDAVTPQPDGSVSCQFRQPNSNGEGKLVAAPVQVDRIVVSQAHCPLPRELFTDQGEERAHHWVQKLRGLIPAAVREKLPTRMALSLEDEKFFRKPKLIPARQVIGSWLTERAAVIQLHTDEPSEDEEKWSEFRNQQLSSNFQIMATNFAVDLRRVNYEDGTPRMDLRMLIFPALFHQIVPRALLGGGHKYYQATYLSAAMETYKENPLTETARKIVVKLAKDMRKDKQNRLTRMLLKLSDENTILERKERRALDLYLPDFIDTIITQDWIQYPGSGETLPKYVVPICDANHGFLPHSSDFGLNHNVVEAFYAAKHWSKDGLPAGFQERQYFQAAVMQRVLKRLNAPMTKPFAWVKRLYNRKPGKRYQRALVSLVSWKTLGNTNQWDPFVFWAKLNHSAGFPVSYLLFVGTAIALGWFVVTSFYAVAKSFFDFLP